MASERYLLGIVVLAALASCALASGTPLPGEVVDETHVRVLTTETFDDVLKNTELALVEFYAPW